MNTFEQITHTIEHIDPEQASRYLATNTQNRSLSLPTVNRYHRDMMAGRFPYVGDPIRFDRDGRLIDGQHRLSALAKMGPRTTIPFLVLRGLAVEAQVFLDGGRSRTAADQLAMDDVPGASDVAAGVRLHLRWEQGWLFRSTNLKVSKSEVIEWVHTHRDVVDQLSPLRRWFRSAELAPSYGYAVALRTREVDFAETCEFFDLLANGGAPQGSAALALDQRLRRDRQRSVRRTDVETLGLVVTAWNHFRTGSSLTRLQAPKGGWNATNFPVPA